MSLPRLIGLYSPAPGCGKTTAANLLIEHQRVSFAAPLKRVVSHMLNSLGLEGVHYAYVDKEAIIPELGDKIRPITARYRAAFLALADAIEGDD